jgi:gluconokinase
MDRLPRTLTRTAQTPPSDESGSGPAAIGASSERVLAVDIGRTDRVSRAGTAAGTKTSGRAGAFPGPSQLAKAAYFALAAVTAAAAAAAAAVRLISSRLRQAGDLATAADHPSFQAIVVMGPSGCGKSTLARALAEQCGLSFIEGDDHHPPRNIAKLEQGTPLSEKDRRPFLDSIGRTIRDAARPVTVSCSALRRAHRDRLREFASNVMFVWIDVPAGELRRRVQGRVGHFMPASLLDDQLATFEPPLPPECFIRVDGMLPTESQLRAVLRGDCADS